MTGGGSGSPEAGARLRIAAERDAEGRVRATWLLLTKEGRLAVGTEVGDGEDPPLETLPLPPRALGAVFARYGKPLEEGVAVPEDAPALHCRGAPGSAGARLRPLRFRPYGWALPLDYLVLEAPGGEPLCAPAPLVAAALLHLGRSARAAP